MIEAYELRPGEPGPETGEVYPQVLHMPERYEFHLDPGAHRTDLLSQMQLHEAGLLVSTAFCEVLGDHAVHPHAVHDAIVADGRVQHAYRWLQFVDDLEQRLDYRACRFLVAGREARVASPAALAAVVLRLSERPGETITAERLVFAPGTPTLDLFCLQLAPRRTFITGPLAAALAAASLTGIQVGPGRTRVVWPEGQRR